MGFCTIADIQAFLQVTIPYEKQLAAERAIAEATAIIQTHCHQHLERVTDDVVTLDIPYLYSTKLALPELPVISVGKVVEDGVELATSEYRLGAGGWLYRVGDYWTQGVQIVTITYTHGFSPLPDDLVGICTRMAARAYQAGLRSEESLAIPGVQGKSLGDYSVTFGGEQGGAGESTLGASAAPLLLRSEERALDARYTYRC